MVTPGALAAVRRHHAAALAGGDFRSIQQPVEGIAEVQHLQSALAEMSRKVQAAQEEERMRGTIEVSGEAPEPEPVTPPLYVQLGPDVDAPHDFGLHLKTDDAANPDLVVHVLSDWGP